jgi:hypothetical protein
LALAFNRERLLRTTSPIRGGSAFFVRPLDHTTVNRYFQLILILVALACTAASCGPSRVATSGPWCGFADPEFTTALGVCDLVAEYCITHHEWPLTKSELEEQLRRSLEKDRPHISADEARETYTFLNRFTLLNMQRSGDHLRFRYRFEIDRKTVDQIVTFAPGPTADEILNAAMANGKRL